MTGADPLSVLTGPGGPFALRVTEIGGVPVRVFASAPDSLRDILLATERFAGRDFLVDGEERMTFAEHLTLVRRIAAWLSARGVGRGDRVAIAMRNLPEWVIAFWATQLIGAVAVALNARGSAAELAYGLSDSGSRVLFVDAERRDRLADRLDGADLDAVVVVRGTAVDPDEPSWAELAAADADAAAGGQPGELPTLGPEDVSTILYTSGTTGRPKGAVVTHRNQVTNYMTMAMLGTLGPADAPAPSTLMTYPLFSISGVMLLYTYTGFGGTIVLQHRWELTEALALIERERIAALSAVPAIIRELLGSPERRRHDLSSLRSIATGASPITPDLVAGMGELIGGPAVSFGYGLTEATGGVAVNAGPDCLRRPESVGRPFPHVDVRIVDPDSGADLDPGSVGEIWCRGPNVVAGYWRAPRETAASFPDGWFRTGDLGRLDPDGMLHVVDRLKDVIIRGGDNVYCAEVEAALFSHPDVADVAVVGVPDRRLDEAVAAVVVPSAGASVQAGALRAHAARSLAAYKVPTLVIARAEPLPRNASGKVDKRALRAELSRMTGPPGAATMRALTIPRFGGPEVLTVAEIPIPPLRPGQVRLRVLAAAVSPADVGMRADGGGGVLTGDGPWVPGMDAAGTVTELGPPSTRDGDPFAPRVGDRVMAVVVPFGERLGAMADLVAVPAASVVAIPDGIGFDEAATIPMNALTADLALRTLDVRAGDAVAVTGGAGFLASLFIELAVHAGARVIADASDADAPLVRGFGAEVVVRGDDFAGRVRALVPDGVDAAFDTALLYDAVLGAVRDGGRVVSARPWAGSTERGIETGDVLVGPHAKDHAALKRIAGLLAGGVLVPRVHTVWAPAQAAQAHRLMEAGGVRGRPVIRFS